MTAKEGRGRPGAGFPPADVAVIGAGAAGLMCAIEAGRRGRSVLVLEHNDVAGRKILVSGGGHCNFTNIRVTPDDYFSSNPDFAKSALSRYRPRDFTDFLDAHRVPYQEKESGQMFVSGPASHLVSALEDECAAAGVTTLCGCPILGISRTGRFRIETGRGTLSAESLVVAAGGLARPDLGATGFGMRIAAEFGLSVVPPAAALAGFLWSEQDRARFGELTGIAIDARVTCGPARFDGSILFTHYGLSGPAAMNATLAWKKGLAVSVDFVPGVEVVPPSSRNDPPAAARRKSADLLKRLMPERLALRLAGLLPAPGIPLARWSPKERQDFERGVHSWRFLPAGTEGFEKAEVMRGGVDTRELSSKTLECRRVPGLYFAGEVLDVTGKVGGFNLHWAWASGFAAGQAV